MTDMFSGWRENPARSTARSRPQLSVPSPNVTPLISAWPGRVRRRGSVVLDFPGSHLGLGRRSEVLFALGRRGKGYLLDDDVIPLDHAGRPAGIKHHAPTARGVLV